MLTRKHFIKRANEFIQLSKNAKRNTTELIILGSQINTYCKLAKESNPRFSSIRFRDWIERGLYE